MSTSYAHIQALITQCVTLDLPTPVHITDSVPCVCVEILPESDSTSASINGNERHLLRNSSPKMAALLPHQMWKTGN